MLSRPVIVAARRTPIGTAGRALAGLRVEDLAAPVLRAVLADAEAVLGEPVTAVDDVVLGNCMGPGGNPARVSALAAGLGVGVPGMTVDRQCGSGLEAINLAAAMVSCGAATLVLAGGAESASTAPLRYWQGPDGQRGQRYTRAPFAPEAFGDPEMGVAAETVAAAAGISRARQDRYAAASHAAAVAASRRGDFAGELVEVGGLVADQRPRAGLTEARLARLRAAFVEGGTVTAGNSCGVSDGAAAVAVVPERAVRAAGGTGLLVRDWATCGVDPFRLGVGLVPAVEAVLERAGLTVSDLDAVEFTEAFAGQVLACVDTLGLAEDQVCTGGGAIALGHPWGASGAVLMVRLFSRLLRSAGNGAGHGAGHGAGAGTGDPADPGTGRRYGLAACAIGGGMGVATLVERVDFGGHRD